MVESKGRRGQLESPYGYSYTVFGLAQRCIWCGGRFMLLGPLSKSREHVIPQSMGGQGYENWAAAHRVCNNRRSSRIDWLPWHFPLDQMPLTQKDWLAQHLGPDFTKRRR